MSRTREIRVGALIMAAVTVAAVGIFLIGDRQNIFSRKNRYYVEFVNVSGLKPGNPVQLNGVDAGTVDSVELPASQWRGKIRVWMRIESRYANRIRAPLKPEDTVDKEEPSLARIKTLGLLGDKYVDITSGSPTYPVVPNLGQIPSAQPTSVDALFASGEDTMNNIVEISSSLKKILARMERGEGILGALTSDTPGGLRFKESLVGTSESLERIATQIDQSQGAFGRLVNDQAMGDQLASSIGRFEALMVKAESGDGLLPGLLNDGQAKARFDETLASLSQAAADIKKLTASFDGSDALLPKLLNDEEYGRQVTEQLRQTVERLNEISRKISEGDGTAAKLINDPQIYEAVDDILVGVEESRLLRWLIRNRQKKGIKERVEDTKKELEEQGIPEAPPP
jgi:phospholipid/cholesterol/gamma-HCH transport system substrate-binding protein